MPELRAALRLVLVHGAPDRAASFGPVLRQLRDLDPVAYDRPGYGSRAFDEDRPFDTIETQAEHLLSLVGPGPALVAGHSFGAIVGMAAAIRSAGPIRSLALWEPPITWDDWWPDPRMSGSIEELASTAAEATATVGERFGRRLVGEGWSSLSAPERQRYRAEGRALCADMRAVRAAPFSLTDLATPALVGSGTLSGRPYQAVARRLAAELGAPLLAYPGVRHLAHVDAPAVFANFVRTAWAWATTDAGGG